MRTIEECAEFIENVTGANLADNDLSDTVRMYANILDGIPFNRLQEICQAECEGRCVVLPFKIGETVYRIAELMCGEKKIVEGKFLSYYNCFQTEFYFSEPTGQYSLWLSLDKVKSTVFLTKSEAEKALKERKND